MRVWEVGTWREVATLEGHRSTVNSVTFSGDGMLLLSGGEEGTVRFFWEEDPRAETEGVVVAVDVTRHAHRAGLETPTFVSRGVWVRFIGAGSGQEQRLLDNSQPVSSCKPVLSFN